MIRRRWSRVVSLSTLSALAVAGMAMVSGSEPASRSTADVVDGFPAALGRSTGARSGDQVIAPPPDDFGGAPVIVEPPPPQLDEFDGVTPRGGTWAVVIGINNYPGGGHDLNSAVADARDVNQALAAYGVAGSQRLLITDRQASGNTIRRAARWLVAHAGPDATAVFFFAGHVRKVAPGTEALVGADGSLVTDAEVADLLRPLQARRTWIGIAACYGGGFTEILAPGRILTGAASANQLAYENSSFGRSYMVEFMVRRAMIEGRSPGSVESAFAWARAELQRQYPNRMPVQLDHFDGDLTLNGGQLPPAAAPASPTADAPSGGSTDGSGSAPPPSGGQGSTPPPPKDDDDCAKLTFGVVNC